ncbi:epsin-3 [Apium graveolens]|uniref:epsin-3 n=1 Tax=Apium graveolens TaxID=4045 RepID=UPI003D7B028D
MANLLLDHIKKQTTSFLHEKYNIARMAFTDVTPAEVLTEEATNDDPSSPDARTMTRIAMASFDVNNCWRIAEVLHRRFDSFEFKQWRQSYKALVLLEFLLAHGPDNLAREYRCDTQMIQDLSTFTYKDENGFDWGLMMRKRSERVLELLKGGDVLKQERLHALKITNQIQGFGNNTLSPCSSSSSSPSSSRASNCSSFGSFSTSTTPIWNEADEFSKFDVLKDKIPAKPKFEASHLWDPSAPIEEKDSLLDDCNDEEEAEEGLHNYEEDVYEDDDNNQYGDQRVSGFFSGIRSKFGNVSPVGRSDHSERVAFRCISDVGRAKVKRTERQFSSKYD